MCRCIGPVCELVEAITPVMSRKPIGVHCGLLKGDLRPRGDLLCISHALLHKVASETESGASDAELKPWLRMRFAMAAVTLQNICSQKLMVHAGGTRSDVAGPGIPKT